MRAIVVSDRNSRAYGATCRAGCGRTIQPGQVVLFHNDAWLPWDKAVFAVHAKCAQRLLDLAPRGNDPDEYEAARERVLAGQPLFG